MAHYLLIRDSELLPITPGVKKLRMAMLADALLQRGHQVTWFASTFNHMAKELYFDRDQSIQLTDDFSLVLKYVGQYSSNLSFARIKHHKLLSKHLHAFLNQNRCVFDAIVVSHPIIELAYVATKHAKKHRIPIVLDVRDKWPETFSDYMPSYLRPLVRCATAVMKIKTQYSFRSATEVTSMSDYMAKWIGSYSNRKKAATVFHLGTSLDGAHESCQSMVREGAYPLVCTYVGGLIKSYDLDLLMQAANELNEDVVCRSGGEGPTRAVREAMPVNNNVEFLGWCNSDGVSKDLLLADILLFPVSSALSQDVMPNKLFDYLWAGRPILACVHGEAADLIRDHKLGYVFKHGDLKDFLKGLSYLSNPDVRIEISMNIRRIYSQRFSAKKIYGAFADLAESLL